MLDSLQRKKAYVGTRRWGVLRRTSLTDLTFQPFEFRANSSDENDDSEQDEIMVRGNSCLRIYFTRSFAEE